MSHLKNKSDFNGLAIDTLQKNSLHAPAVHCAYYRCIQYMLHILFHKLKIDKADFDYQVRQQKGGGTHALAIRLITKELISRKKNEEHKDFQRLIPKLKVYRETSDYYDEEVTSTDSLDAKAKSDSIMNILISSFK